MRPRVIPAEDLLDLGALIPGGRNSSFASMRPRVIPAEDELHGRALFSATPASQRRFNEAAGYPRGRLAEQR